MSERYFLVMFLVTLGEVHSSCTSSYGSLLENLDECYYEINGNADSSNDFWDKCIAAVGTSVSPKLTPTEVAQDHPCLFCLEETIKLLWDMEFNPSHECFMVNDVSPCGLRYGATRDMMVECLRSGGRQIVLESVDDLYLHEVK